MKRYLILFILTFSFFKSYSQCLPQKQSFNVGEVLYYDAYYNWNFVWVNVGNALFSVKETTYKNKYYYNFYSYGNSNKKHDWFFTVRDTFEVMTDPIGLKPLKFKQHTFEGGYEVNNTYVFNHKIQKIFTFTQNSKKPFTKDTLKLDDCTLDLLTAIYYARNIDFSKYKTGDKIPVKVIIDNEIFNLYIRYIGVEVVENKDGKKYRCIKFSAMLVEGTLFKGGEDLTVWVTDDDNKIPIVVQAKILVGSVKVYLNYAKNIRHQTDCLITN